MTTVTITSDLESYLASLQSYLAHANVDAPQTEDEGRIKSRAIQPARQELRDHKMRIRASSSGADKKKHKSC